MTGEKIAASWLSDAGLQRVLETLSGDGEETRIVGGAVRNHLMGLPITDVDLATTAPPQEVVRRAEAVGIKAVPTGIAHGTVTLVDGGRPFEVTTLRSDVETDGRHAKVVFGRDWEADARRRDFTINALYAAADGTVFDLVGGRADIAARTIRFIGDASSRIAEDYLRILRFYRFFAWYGAGRPDAEGMRASARMKDGLVRLSAERVWSELRRLLAAPDPSRALLWMRQASVLTAVLPESERWGIDAIHGLVAAEAIAGRPADAMLRLMAIVPPDAARLAGLAGRLKVSGAERDRLTAFAMTAAPDATTSDSALRSLLYVGDRQAVEDRLTLAHAGAAAKGAAGLGETARLAAMLDVARGFEKPRLPVTGADLAAAGIETGPRMGKVLRQLEAAFVESGFTLDRAGLLARLSSN